MFQLANVEGEAGSRGAENHSTTAPWTVFVFLVHCLYSETHQESFPHVPNKTYLLNNYDSDFLLKWFSKDGWAKDKSLALNMVTQNLSALKDRADFLPRVVLWLGKKDRGDKGPRGCKGWGKMAFYLDIQKQNSTTLFCAVKLMLHLMVQNTFYHICKSIL